jgi:hypothetical protein
MDGTEMYRKTALSQFMDAAAIPQHRRSSRVCGTSSQKTASGNWPSLSWTQQASGSGLGETAWLCARKAWKFANVWILYLPNGKIVEAKNGNFSLSIYLIFALRHMCTKEMAEEKKKQKEEIKSNIRKWYSWLEATGQ